MPLTQLRHATRKPSDPLGRRHLHSTHEPLVFFFEELVLNLFVGVAIRVFLSEHNPQGRAALSRVLTWPNAFQSRQLLHVDVPDHRRLRIGIQHLIPFGLRKQVEVQREKRLHRAATFVARLRSDCAEKCLLVIGCKADLHDPFHHVGQILLCE